MRKERTTKLRLQNGDSIRLDLLFPLHDPLIPLLSLRNRHNLQSPTFSQLPSRSRTIFRSLNDFPKVQLGTYFEDFT